jgi:hypothetical protein
MKGNHDGGSIERTQAERRDATLKRKFRSEAKDLLKICTAYTTRTKEPIIIFHSVTKGSRGVDALGENFQTGGQHYYGVLVPREIADPSDFRAREGQYDMVEEGGIPQRVKDKVGHYELSIDERYEFVKRSLVRVGKIIEGLDKLGEPLDDIKKERISALESLNESMYQDDLRAGKSKLEKNRDTISGLYEAARELSGRIASFKRLPRIDNRDFADIARLVDDDFGVEKLQEKIKVAKETLFSVDGGKYYFDLNALDKEIGFVRQRAQEWAERLDKETQEEEGGEVKYHFGGGFRLIHDTKGSDYLVVSPDGTLRQEDAVEYGRGFSRSGDRREGEKRWDKIKEDELGLFWQGSGDDKPQLLEVIKKIKEGLSDEQIACIRRLEIEHGVPRGTFGFDKENEKGNEEALECFRGVIRDSRFFEKIPAKLVDIILERVQTKAPFEAYEGLEIVDENTVRDYVWQQENILDERESDKRIKELVGKIFPDRTGTATDKVFNKQSVTNNQAYLVGSVKTSFGVLDFFKYKYSGRQHINVCLRKYEAGEGHEAFAAKTRPKSVEAPVLRGRKEAADESRPDVVPAVKIEKEKVPPTSEQLMAFQQSLGMVRIGIWHVRALVGGIPKTNRDERKVHERLTGRLEKLIQRSDSLWGKIGEEKNDGLDVSDLLQQTNDISSEWRQIGLEVARVSGKKFIERFPTFVSESIGHRAAVAFESGVVLSRNQEMQIEEKVFEKVYELGRALTKDEVFDVLVEVTDA